MPLLFSSLLGTKIHHHYEVQGSSLPVGPGIGNDVLVDQQLAVAGCHRSDQLRQNFLACLVIPVVQDGVQEIYSRT